MADTNDDEWLYGASGEEGEGPGQDDDETKQEEVEVSASDKNNANEKTFEHETFDEHNFEEHAAGDEDEQNAQDLKDGNEERYIYFYFLK